MDWYEAFEESEAEIGNLRAENERLKATTREHDLCVKCSIHAPVSEVERLQDTADDLHGRLIVSEQEVERVKQVLTKELTDALEEVERLRKERDEFNDLYDEAEAEVERLTHDLHEARLNPMQDDEAEVERLRGRVAGLEKALDRAGDRLAQVQPGVTEPWAFDIVPMAEQEIAAALAEEES